MARYLLVLPKLPKKFLSVLSVEEATEGFLYHFKSSSLSLTNTAWCWTPHFSGVLTPPKSKAQPSECLLFPSILMLFKMQGKSRGGCDLQRCWLVTMSDHQATPADHLFGSKNVVWTLLSIRSWFGRQEEFLSTDMGCSVGWPLCPKRLLCACNQSASTDLA